MESHDGRFWIVFNGEIYNFPTLREELRRSGCQFRSRTDTEVLLHLYERYGDDCVHRLDGMFAFVIYETAGRTLFGARDRLGVKPLYYSENASHFAFASEPKALLALPGVSRTPNFDEFPSYLTFNCLPGPGTLFRDIAKLPPATRFRVDPEGGFRSEQYWTVAAGPRAAPAGHDGAEAVVRALQAAGEKRLLSDVPFGAMLSGGLDSSLTVAFMAMAASEPIRTFTVGYPGDQDDASSDLRYARLVAERYSTDHREVIVSEADVLEAMETLPALADDPIGAPSVAANVVLAKAVRQAGVTVAQVGEGGDEVFFGYSPAFRLLRLGGRLDALGRWMPRSAFRWAVRPLEVAHRAAGERSLLGSLDGSIPALLDRWTQKQVCYWGHGVLFARSDLAPLLSVPPSAEPYSRLRDRLAAFGDVGARPLLDRLTLVDMALGLPERLLMRVDRATMLFGLEARVPFLDPRVIDAAFDIPPAQRVPQPKAILKRVAARFLPAEILTRPKVGFPTARRIFTAPAVRARVRDRVLEARFLAASGLRRDAVLGILSRFERGESAGFYRAWALNVAALWFRHWVLDAPGD
jgi:asparagine synthase (glutamine-hydrolysing)